MSWTVRPEWLLLSLGLGGGVALLTDCRAPVSHMQVNEGEACSSCHQSDFQTAQQPLHVGIISEDCEQCHSNTQWVPARGSDHSFPLDGPHAETPCNDCHVGQPPLYEGTPETCIGCHEADRDAVEEPSHAEFDTDCLSCHTSDAWSPATIDHEWPLLGAHANAGCSDCHTGEPPRYEGTPTECIQCHQADRDEARDPSHSGFSNDCGSCHTSQAWRPADFPEHEWPLEGAHSVATCGSCHQGDPPQYEGVPTDCVGCHADDRDAAVEPPHEGFSNDCSTCHGTASWDSASFAHTVAFPLEGGHAGPACGDCHTGSPAVFEGLSSACVSCHADDRDAAVEPPHDGFSDDCTTCHGTASWDSASFLHTAAFPLEGGHAGPACGDCHTGSPAVFEGLSSACVDCHRQDYDQSPFPGHDTFSTTCQDCHSTRAWTPATGGAHPENRFSTRGDHNFQCNECHNPALGPNGAGNADCVGCHEGEHTLARMDREHQGEVRNYPTGPNRAPNFCLACHPNGRE